MKKKTSQFPGILALAAAHERVAPYIHRTPVLSSRYFDGLCNAHLFFKGEHFQKTGSFKIRGVLNSILSLPREEISAGLATYSSGNHAQALAYGARLFGVPAFVAMPLNANPAKVLAAEGYGAKIFYFSTAEGEREVLMARILRETGARFIHPYDAMLTIEGQSGAAKELLEDVPCTLDILIVPVGGGGILAGSALAANVFSPGTLVYAAEPETACDAFDSFHAKKRLQRPFGGTVADGLRTNLGNLNCKIMLELAAGVLPVSEKEIMDATLAVWQRMKVLIETSAAVAVAAAIRYHSGWQGKKIGIMLTGGNADLSAQTFG